MTGDEVTSESSAREPLCPNCRESLRGNLRQERVVPEGGTAVAVTYCGACGWTLACLPGCRYVTARCRSKRWPRPRMSARPRASSSSGAVS